MSFASFLSVIVSLLFTAHSSTAHSFLTSVAVVITGVAPIRLAIFLESSLAPPTCPDNIGMTNSPASSRLIIAGSVNLSFKNLDISLTVIPMAPINIIAFTL